MKICKGNIPKCFKCNVCGEEKKLKKALVVHCCKIHGMDRKQPYNWLKEMRANNFEAGHCDICGAASAHVSLHKKKYHPMTN
jgi:hypothetical protein